MQNARVTIHCKQCQQLLLELTTDEVTAQSFAPALGNFVGMGHAPQHRGLIDLDVLIAPLSPTPTPNEAGGIYVPQRGLFLPGRAN